MVAVPGLDTLQEGFCAYKKNSKLSKHCMCIKHFPSLDTLYIHETKKTEAHKTLQLDRYGSA